MTSAPSTLVTLIGRGRKDEGGQTYQRVAYAFDSEAHESVFFVDAVLASRHGVAVDEVVVCGTRTSSWGALVEHLVGDGEAALYVALEDATEAAGGTRAVGASDALLAQLADLLSQVWRRRVRCIAVTHESVDDSNVEAVVDLFLSVFPFAQRDRVLLLDTTHGFRTLSLAASVAVDLGDALVPGFSRRTRHIYGELKGKVARGIVFQSVTRAASIGAALRLFLDTFDATDLVPLLRQHAPQLADALKDFSETMLTNSLRRLDETARRMLNALEREPELPSTPGWVLGVRRAVHDIAGRLGRTAGPVQLLALAELRAERGHTALAILTLWEAVCWVACGDRVKRFDDLNDELTRFRKQMKQDRKARPYLALRQLRNQVAHGAAVADDSGQRDPASLKKGYRAGLAFVQGLLNDLV